MALQSYASNHRHKTAPVSRHQDIEFEIGALASRHGITLDAARAIVEHCGSDLDCIDEQARAWKGNA